MLRCCTWVKGQRSWRGTTSCFEFSFEQILNDLISVDILPQFHCGWKGQLSLGFVRHVDTDCAEFCSQWLTQIVLKYLGPPLFPLTVQVRPACCRLHGQHLRLFHKRTFGLKNKSCESYNKIQPSVVWCTVGELWDICSTHHPRMGLLVYSGLLPIKLPSISRSCSTPEQQTISTFGIQVGFPVFCGCPSSPPPPPPPWMWPEACWLWQTHTSVLMLIQMYTGVKHHDNVGGALRDWGLWLKPQDTSADWLTLKGLMNPETPDQHLTRVQSCTIAKRIWWYDQKKPKTNNVDSFWPTGEQMGALFWV